MPAPSLPLPPALADETKPFRGNGEFILILDDDPEMRTVLRTALTALNFRVLASADGMQALLQAGEKRFPLAAVITDLHMPTMSGVTFVDLLKRFMPEAKIIVTSGNFTDEAIKQFRELGVHAVLDKPFSRQKLLDVLKWVL